MTTFVRPEFQVLTDEEYQRLLTLPRIPKCVARRVLTTTTGVNRYQRTVRWHDWSAQQFYRTASGANFSRPASGATCQHCGAIAR